MKVGIIGAGRIGKVHAKNISMFVPEMEIKTIADPFMNEQTEAFAKSCGIPNTTKDANDILNDPEIEAVLICSSTDTHSKYIIEAAHAGKHIFCEKPIDYDLDQGARCHQRSEGSRRQAPDRLLPPLRPQPPRRLRHRARGGKVGKVNIIKISSRDPEPPPVSYVKVSGGIFYDMMIHDFDMARFLAGSEVTEVNAIGSVLVDPGIGEAGDVDTALVTLKFENGAIGVIDNSRKAVYGYDQRVEVFGSEGCAEDQNDTPNTAVLSTADGAVHGVAYKVMWDRYTGAFVAEMQAFADAVINDKETPVTGEDGLYPVLMAAAATKSLHEGRPVKISEIE